MPICAATPPLWQILPLITEKISQVFIRLVIKNRAAARKTSAADNQAMFQLKTWSRYLLGTFFMVAGVNHFWHTDFYLAMMPPYLPAHLTLVHASGIAEILLGALVLVKPWQRVAGWGLVVLSVAVFPANVHMAFHPEQFTQFSATGLWLRLPLQALVIGWALWCTRPPIPRHQPEKR